MIIEGGQLIGADPAIFANIDQLEINLASFSKILFLRNKLKLASFTNISIINSIVF